MHDVIVTSIIRVEHICVIEDVLFECLILVFTTLGHVRM